MYRLFHVIYRTPAANPPSAVSPAAKYEEAIHRRLPSETLLFSQPNTSIQALCCRFHSLYANIQSTISRPQQLARPGTVPTPIESYHPPGLLLPLQPPPNGQSLLEKDTRTHRRRVGNRTKCSLARGWARSYPLSPFSRPVTPSTFQVGPITSLI